jgi:hemolysin activation/secretion protein
MPVAGDGTKAKAYFTTGDFEIGEELGVLKLSGDGTAYGVSVTRPLVRSRRQSVIAELGIDLNDTNFTMDLGGATQGHPATASLSRDRIRKVRLGASIDRVQAGKARELYNVYIHQGLGSFLGGSESTDGVSRAGADNTFTKLAVEAARLQALSDRAVLNIGLTGQYAISRLLTPEEMSIGGADSVRGFTQSKYLGDNGIQASVEVRYDLPGLTRAEGGVSWLQDFKLVAFVDHGTVFRRSTGTEAGDSSSITGAGVGFRAELGGAEYASRYFLRFDLGVPVAGKDSEKGDPTVVPYIRLEHQF